MIEVEPAGPLYAVQWPEGMKAQLAVRDELEKLGVTLRLYDGNVRTADDGSVQWSAASPVGCYRSAQIHDWIVVFEAPVTADSGQIQTYPAALFATLFDEVPDTTPCTAEVWSWDVFRHQQVDPYWIRCTQVGSHGKHEDSNTGATWSS